MGTDKGLLVYNGKPQREFLFELMAACCETVFTSCRKEQNIPARLNPLFDRFNIPGPLNGILSAFSFNPDAGWLIAAVDMPFVDRTALELLISNRKRNTLATCFYNPETQQPEPLLTLWEARARPHLLKFYESGNISPREFLVTHPVTILEPPATKILLNVNHPGDWPD